MAETVFDLNEETGDIITKPGASPDYESMSEYDIMVVAQDQGEPRLSVSYAYYDGIRLAKILEENS